MGVSKRTREWTCPVCGAPNEAAAGREPECRYCGFVVEKFGSETSPRKAVTLRQVGKRKTKTQNQDRFGVIAGSIVFAIFVLLLVVLFTPINTETTAGTQRDTSSPGAALATYVRAFNNRSASLMYSILSSQSKYYNDLEEVRDYLNSPYLVGDMRWTDYKVTGTTQDPWNDNIQILSVEFTSEETHPFGGGKITDVKDLRFEVIWENGEWLWHAGSTLVLSS